MTQLSVSIPEDLGTFVESTVQSGAYAGPSELISQALYSYRDQIELEHIKLIRLKRDLQVGIDQIQRGEVVEDFNVEEFLAEMKRGTIQTPIAA